MTRTVVVTGLGVITPLACDTEEMWRALCAGTSAIESSSDVALSDRPFGAAALRGFTAVAYIEDRRSIRFMNRATTFGVASAALAAADSHLDLGAVPRGRLGAFVGAPGRSYESAEFEPAVAIASDHDGLHWDRFGRSGIDLLNPTWSMRALGNSVLYYVTAKYHAVGMNGNFPSGGDAATVAIGEACRAIQWNHLDVALAGGYDSLLIAERIAMYRGANLLSSSPGASRSFDRQRDGFAAAEGAAFLVLEEESHARRRGAHIYCEIAGYGAATAALNPSTLGPSRAGFAASLGKAMADARCESVDAIVAHGLATWDSDREETAGIKATLGARASRTPVTSMKSMLGNACAASGAVEAAAACLALRDQCLPPTANLTERDPDCDLDYVVGPARSLPLDTVALNNASLGGAHASLVLRRAE